MDNAFEKLIDIIIAIILLFILPIIYFGLKQDNITQQIIQSETVDFTENVRNHGYITKTMLENYLGNLNQSKILYDINMEHKMLLLEPEYRFKTSEEIIEDQNNVWNGENIYTYRPVFTEIPHITDPINNDDLAMNTETNQTILANAVDGAADPNHVHTKECYNGHRHEGEPYFYHNHAHSQYSCKEYINVQYAHITCKQCSYVYERFVATWYWDSEKNERAVGSYWPGQADCYDCGSLNVEAYSIYGYGYSCGYDTLNPDGSVYDVKVPYDVTYQYKRSKPQYNYSYRYDNSNGCYFYHHSNLFDTYSAYGELRYYNPVNVIYQLNHYGTSKYCKYPEFFQFGLRRDNGWSRGYTVTYRASLLDDGSMVLKLYDYVMDYETYPGYYPEYISWETANRIAFDDGFKEFYDEYVYATTPNWYEYPENYINETDCWGVIDVCGHDPSKINQWIVTCGKSKDTTYDCNTIIVSIQPTHPKQAVYINEPLITTATITYGDGSTKVVECTSDFIPDKVVNNKTITLSYQGFAATIEVTVVPKSKTCIHNHQYNLANDGSDPGCPYCDGWLERLEVTNPTSGKLTIYKGSTLEENGVILLATYLNGRTEVLHTGYAHNLDENFVGTQTVSLSFKGKYTSLTVITIRNINPCNKCGRFYELYPDNTDPGCPYCAALIPVFTGNVLKYYKKIYTSQIIKEIYEGNGIYYFNSGDHFGVDVSNQSKTFGSKIYGAFIPGLPKVNLHVSYGGDIRDEKE